MISQSSFQAFIDVVTQLFLGNEEKVYILDKAEGNAAQINGHPAWGSVWCVSEPKQQSAGTDIYFTAGISIPMTRH